MEDLIKRLEDATEASRELDRLIGEAMQAPLANCGDLIGLGYQRFTSSIDAALTLVPNGLTWNAGTTDEHFEGPIIAFAKVMTREYLPEGWHARGATPAIALCIAAIAARSAQTEG